jgi:hypothetical protein
VRIALLILGALALGGALFAIVVPRHYYLGPGRWGGSPGDRHRPSSVPVDLRATDHSSPLPRYVDLCVGDTLKILRSDREELPLCVVGVAVESRRWACPRTRVILEHRGERHDVRCGMEGPREGGVGRTSIDGVAISAEITRLLFSRSHRGTSPFNTFRRFRLRGDVRLAVWSPTAGGGPSEASGRFVLDQPEWTRDRFGNWLHTTRYGIHGGIDLFATRDGVPEPVLSPVDGTVHRIYHADADPDDRTRSKVVNLWGKAEVGPDGGRVLYRFLHLSEILVADGDRVRRGQVIGFTGHTGFDAAIDDHLHFEMRLNPSCLGLERDDSVFATIPVNPYNFLLDWYELSKPGIDVQEVAI